MLLVDKLYEEEWLSQCFTVNPVIEELQEHIIGIMGATHRYQSINRIKDSIYTVSLSLARMTYLSYPLKTLFKAGIKGKYTNGYILDGKVAEGRIGLKGVNATIACLFSNGYIDIHICSGNYDKYPNGESRYSNMVITEKGSQLIKILLGNAVSYKHLRRKESNIVMTKKNVILRDEKLSVVEFKITPEVRKMIKNVEGYNSLMQDVVIKDYHSVKVIPPLEACRIFCRGSFKDGGRFYYQGRSPQQMSQDDRLRLTIDGESVVELDYKAIHIAIIDLDGGRPWSDPNRDPYYLMNYSWVLFSDLVDEDFIKKSLRNIIKKAFVVAINVDSEDVARYVLKDIVTNNKDGIMDGVEDICIDGLIAELRNYHPDFENALFSGIGTKLQRVDSDIAEKVLVSCTGANIPVICVHDSFIVQRQHRDTLRGFMEDAWVAVLGSNDNCGIAEKFIK